MKPVKIRTQDTVLQEIAAFASKTGCSFLDATLDYCEKHDLDIVQVGESIRRTEIFKSKINEEAKNLKLLKE